VYKRQDRLVDLVGGRVVHKSGDWLAVELAPYEMLWLRSPAGT